VALLASLVTDRRDTQVVNVRNAGTMPFLPDEAVIEVPAVIGADGTRPVPVAPLDPLLRGLVGHVSAYEELAVEAAVRGGRRRVLAALLAHPLIGQYDLAGQLADRLIAENQAYLPWADTAAAR
jgi:6-phospho-beta-glucosidase